MMVQSPFPESEYFSLFYLPLSFLAVLNYSNFFPIAQIFILDILIWQNNFA